MAWIKSNARAAVLNLSAICIMAVVLTQGSADANAADTFDPGLESGKWAVRLLLFCLSLSPMNTYFGWASAIKLRSSAGLWAFAFAVLHVFYYLRATWPGGLMFGVPPFIALGMLGLAVLAALAVTSNRWAMRQLGRNWKRLHRLVYLAGPAVLVHAILAAAASKRMFLRDPHAVRELTVYAALLGVLLAVRIPLVRRALRRGLPQRRPALRPEVPIIPVVVAERRPAYQPPTGAPAIDAPLPQLAAKVGPAEEVERRRAVAS